MVFLVEGGSKRLRGSNKTGHMLEDCTNRHKVPEQLIMSTILRYREAYHASYNGFVKGKREALLRW